MSLVGKIPNKRQRVRVTKTAIAQFEPSNREPPVNIETARYIADVCAEMAWMAKAVNLTFLSHLLSMARAEAECAVEVAA